MARGGEKKSLAGPPHPKATGMYGLSLDESDDEEEFSGDSGWIPWFCGLKGHELIAEVEEDYVRDNFNLYGLRTRFQFYDHALEMILSAEAPDEDDLADPEFLEIYRDATDLYGLIHVRYIVSPRGLQVMREKYLKGTFGTCPRVLCDRQHVLPIGTSEDLLCRRSSNALQHAPDAAVERHQQDLRAAQVKIFCPKCEQVYSAKSKYKELDGAYFGTSFPQIFLQSYPSLVPLEPPRPFVPRVFGFKLHKQKSLILRKLEEDAGLSHSQPGSTAKQAEKPPGAREGPEEGPGARPPSGEGTRIVDDRGGRAGEEVF